MNAIDKLGRYNLTRFSVKESSESRFERLVMPIPEAGCFLWTGAVSGRYGNFCLNGRREKAHRVSWRLAGKELPEGLELCHKCDTPTCVNVNHLFLGSHKQNMLDAAAKKRMPHNERQHSAKLTVSKVLQIKSDSRPHRVIAAEFGVSEQQVSKIKAGKAWYTGQTKADTPDSADTKS